MAIFDLPLKVRLSLQLYEKEPDFSGFSVVEKKGKFFAERELMLSLRVHRQVALDSGMFSPQCYGSALAHAMYRDATSDLGRSAMQRIREVIYDTNRSGVFGGEANRKKLVDELVTFQTKIGRHDNNAYGRYEVVVSEDDAWKLREGMRFVNEQYREVPPQWQMWELYPGSVLDPASDKFIYAHISVNNDGMIAFTENSKKGNADIQKRMKPGKFLKEFFGEQMNALYGENKANAKIAEMAAQFGNHIKEEELLFAKTPEEIEWVYTNGPSSCMSHTRDEYDTRGKMHPVGVFGAGDLEVAHIKRNGRVTARALVWPEKKVWTRIYGDHTRIQGLLVAQGYKAGGSFCLDGAKLNLVKHGSRWDNGIVAPYVDGQSWARADGEHLVIDHDKGYIFLQNTCGTSEDGKVCKVCSKLWRAQEMRSWRDAPGEREKIGCLSCWEKETWVCQMTGERLGQGYTKVTMANGDIWSERGFEGYGFTCGYDKQNYPIDGTRWHNHHGSSRDYDQRVVMWNGTFWLKKNFDAHGKTYEGERYSQEEYERKILKDMGQSDLPLAEAEYARRIEERQRKAKEERDAYYARILEQNRAREAKEKENRLARRRKLHAFRKAMEKQGVMVSRYHSNQTPHERYFAEVERYYWCSSQTAVSGIEPEPAPSPYSVTTTSGNSGNYVTFTTAAHPVYEFDPKLESVDGAKGA